MACVLVQGVETGGGGRIVSAGESSSGGGGAPPLDPERTMLLYCTNTSMFEDKLTSDIHAEANA
jgi:hypothetical protein